MKTINSCNTLQPTGPFFLERNHFGEAVPMQFTGGQIIDGVYDLVAADSYFPPSDIPQAYTMAPKQRTISVANKGTLWNIVDYLESTTEGREQFYNGFTLSFTSTGVASLSAVSSCGLNPDSRWNYLYTATPDFIIMEYLANQEILFYLRR